MAERIVSPGVFTRERDLSFLTQGISELGGAFIGPTPKGPAFIPTVVRGQQEYVTAFGEADALHYTGLTVKNYLRESAVATVVRVLGLSGYTGATPAVLTVSGSLGEKVFAVLHPSSDGVSIASASASGSATSFSLGVDVNGTAADVTATGLSLTPSTPGYIADLLGYLPTTAKGAYIYSIFPEALAAAGDTPTVEAYTSSAVLNFSGTRYSNAATAWVQSQTVGGTNLDLFKLHTLSDGVSANKELKVSFLNMKPAANSEEWATFSMLIRQFDDTDNRPIVLEQYDNLNFDPDSPTYLARVIGDGAPTEDPDTGEVYYQGNFPNRSRYVYIEMTEGDIPKAAVPFGFNPYSAPINVASSLLTAPTYVETRWLSGSVAGYNVDAIDKKYFYGWSFTDTRGTNASFLAPLPSGSITVGAAFNLEDLTDVPDGITSKSISLGDDDSLIYRKFTVPFQGGFDGLNPARKIALGEDITPSNSQGFNLQNSLSDGSVAYKKALQAISNPEQFDMNLLVLPGVIYDYHSYIATEALTLCEERGDAFYIMDTTALGATIATAVQKAAEIDSSYAGTYWPWLRAIDQNTNRLIWVPPSVLLPEIYAYNDNVAAEWFAVAGLNRGGISSAIDTKSRTLQTQRDTLYEGKVNPIAKFPRQGIAVWGQKTLQRRASALDRINVRRLLIEVKKYIASSSRYLVFEQNVEGTRNRFLNIVNPYLASVQERAGLYAFRVVMDESNNTPDIIDRNVLYGQLYLQPTKTAEMIILDFNVLPTGAIFPTA